MIDVKAACEVCPHFRRGQVRVETWCSVFDDKPSAPRNCEGERHKRWRARIAAGVLECGPWEPDATWLYLPDVPTVVYTADKQRFDQRRESIKQTLESLHFSNWRFVWGKPTEPYWAGTRADYAAILRDNQAPLIFLEDDCAARDFKPWAKIPTGVQVAYLGGGAWGTNWYSHLNKANLPGLKITQVRHFGVAGIRDEAEQPNPDWVRVLGMLGSHAMLFLDRPTMLEISKAITEGWHGTGGAPVDQTYAANQWRWMCALRRVPMFFQRDGHNDWITYQYSTARISGPLPPAYHDRIKERRSRRREALDAR